MHRAKIFILACMVFPVPLLAHAQERAVSPPVSGSETPQSEQTSPAQADKITSDQHTAGSETLPEVPAMPDYPTLAVEDVPAEVHRLTLAFNKEVGGEKNISAEKKALWISLAQKELAEHSADHPLTRPQVLVVVDRNPGVQRLALIAALPGDAEDWQVIGVTKISSGTTGRKYYYITPTGVFANTSDILGYRALGTKNEHGIKGNGVKDMRVWDFGWQWAEKGWLPSREKGQIRLEMHATDPVYLEPRLGHTASEGCVRIPAALNIFIDKHVLIDAEYERAAAIDRRFSALLRKDRNQSPLAGSLLVVVDSTDALKAAHPSKVAQSVQKQHNMIR